MVADAKKAAEQERIYHEANNAYVPLRRTTGPKKVQNGAAKFDISNGNTVTTSTDGDSFTVIVDNPGSGEGYNPLLFKSGVACRWRGGAGPDC